MTDIDSILDRIRAYAARHGRKAILSRESGVHQVQLAGIGRDDWNPTASTIRKLDAAVMKLTAPKPAHEHEQV